MRAALLRSFDEIYLLDLHGNANRQEACPDGSKDENVFDIKQGVCIILLVKKDQSKNKHCRVYHADMFGTRDYKYSKLSNNTLLDLTFEEVFPSAPECLFKQENTDLRSAYEEGFSVDDLFVMGANGIKTARDKFTLGFSQEEVIIAIKTDSWLTKFREESDRMSLIESAANVVTGANPKIVLRSPQADDDKLRNETYVSSLPVEPKKPLIPEKSQNKKEIIEAVNQSEGIEDEDYLSDDDSAEKKNPQIVSSSKREDSAFHSDNVNMVIDLFEGKIIE